MNNLWLPYIWCHRSSPANISESKIVKSEYTNDKEIHIDEAEIQISALQAMDALPTKKAMDAWT